MVQILGVRVICFSISNCFAPYAEYIGEAQALSYVFDGGFRNRITHGHETIENYLTTSPAGSMLPLLIFFVPRRGQLVRLSDDVRLLPSAFRAPGACANLGHRGCDPDARGDDRLRRCGGKEVSMDHSYFRGHTSRLLVQTPYGGRG